MATIKKPGKRLGQKLGLKFIKKSGGRASPIADLNVTPMVDMLTMLVIFLLMTFSASGEILFITKDIVLPKAFHSASLDRAPVIAVSNAAVAFEGEFVMNTGDINERWYADWKLPPLMERLEKVRDQWKADHPDKTFEGQIIIQSDNGVPFAVIKMIMFTCANASYANINFAVQKVGRGDSALAGS